MRKLVIGLLAALLSLPIQAALAEDFQVAVAANFTNPATDIAAAFEKETGDRPVLSFGSTGNFKTQILNGAPFTALLAADNKAPAELEAAGAAVPGTAFTYARGALVLWSSKEGFVDSDARALKDKDFNYLAVANPDLAPYGFAAYEYLRKIGLIPGIEAKVVTGNNISDAFKQVSSGTADLGLIAWSQVCKDNKLTGGSVYHVPAEDYSPILQDAVLLKPGEGSAPAQAFLGYLKGETAKGIILSYGYTLP
jgi:molybdate transport system substrate-binding protein